MDSWFTISRVPSVVAAILLIIMVISLLNHNPHTIDATQSRDVNPLHPYVYSAIPSPSYPLQEAYITDVWKTIEGTNITEVIANANAIGFNSTPKRYIWEWENDQGTITKYASIVYEHTYMQLYYDAESNLTHVAFQTTVEENVTDSLWARLSRIMHVRQDVLKETLWGYKQQYYDTDFVLSGIPDWNVVRAHVGNLTNQVYYLGTMSEQHRNGSILSSTFSVIIQAECMINSPSPNRCVLRMEIDGLGHTRLEIYESRLQRLADPKLLFKPVFEKLGLPISALNDFELNESLWLSSI